MLDLTNLGWPDTPYGAGKRPFPRAVHLLTGLAVQWADNGSEALPVAAAAVFLPVHRTAALPLATQTLNVGYRVVVAQEDGEAPALVAFLDGVLVQGRRHSAGLAWHSYADDRDALTRHASGRMPGITAVGEGWADRTVRERGTAWLTDTAHDLGVPGWTLDRAMEAERVECPTGTSGILSAPALQFAYDRAQYDPAAALDLGASALHQALAVALLGARARERARWEEPLSVPAVLRSVAWDHFPALAEPAGR
ncbi:hypothetical protein [Streptomyces sp. NRRL S-350]|uniref:hypothetical protein n=1 Tax=Streptomyces sp. NRRL S-350 TaxID=1463902 RepID=UPI0004BEF799|nr:hypothetical protein [Streptomyces sp. NRRL S-350]